MQPASILLLAFHNQFWYSFLRLLRNFCAFCVRPRIPLRILCAHPRIYPVTAASKSRSSAAWYWGDCRALPSIKKVSSTLSPMVDILASCSRTPWFASTRAML